MFFSLVMTPGREFPSLFFFWPLFFINKTVIGSGKNCLLDHKFMLIYISKHKT